MCALLKQTNKQNIGTNNSNKYAYDIAFIQYQSNILVLFIVTFITSYSLHFLSERLNRMFGCDGSERSKRERDILENIRCRARYNLCIPCYMLQLLDSVNVQLQNRRLTKTISSIWFSIIQQKFETNSILACRFPSKIIQSWSLSS